MDYSQTLNYIDSFVDFEKIPSYDYTSSFRLERMYAFLQELGNPHHGLNVIHIAGSKGKGSTCIIIASLLKQAGYCVGLYTSPHLLDTRERIRVLGRDSGNLEGIIEKREFIELIEKIKPVAERFREHKELGRLSFFEVLTACAFLYFKQNKVDFAVLETGLGGRLDATNVTMPMVCGITNISMEHTDKLGGSLELIAKEKTGIIKSRRSSFVTRGSAFSALQEKEAMDVIRDVCREKDVSLYEIGKDVTYSIVGSDEDGQVFNLHGPGYSYKNLQMNLIGAHQVQNAALAIGIVRFIDKARHRIDEQTIQLALKNISWPGRIQIVQRRPYIILDGAQNIASVKAVLSSINKIFNYKRLICIFGISSDKDIEGVSRELDKVSDIVILTKSSSSRARGPIYLKEYFSRSNVKMTGNVEEAVRYGLEIADKEDLVLVTGSLYVVADALRSQIRQPRHKAWRTTFHCNFV